MLSDILRFGDSNGAIFSSDGQHRYLLWRTIGESKSSVLFIGLNPSTADENNNDPTIRRCIGFAREWGYSKLFVANLFAFRATKPANMKNAIDPIGPENDYWLAKASQGADMSVAAWGNHGLWNGRSNAVLQMLADPRCLGRTKQGAPLHPLYVAAGEQLVRIQT